MHFSRMARLSTHFVHALHTLKSTLVGNDQGIALSWLTLVFRFDVIFQRRFGGRFCKDNEHLWCHVNKETVDFHTLTFERGSGTALDMLHKSYCPCILMYVLDELLFVFKKLQANNFDMQCVVAYEILQIASCQCTEQCRNRKRNRTHLEMHTHGWTSEMLMASSALFGPCMMGYLCPVTNWLCLVTMIGIIWWQGP